MHMGQLLCLIKLKSPALTKKVLYYSVVMELDNEIGETPIVMCSAKAGKMDGWQISGLQRV